MILIHLMTASEKPASRKDDENEKSHAADERSSAPPDLGPDFQRASWLQSHKSIARYIWNNHSLQILIIIVAAAFLLIGIVTWSELQIPSGIFSAPGANASSAASPKAASPETLAEWLTNLQSFMGIATLLVAILVWYGEMCSNWEASLPKKMSVFFFYAGRPVIVCRYVWLADASDLRAWGQQVAKQAAYNIQQLGFGPDVKAADPVLEIEPNGEMFRHYAVCFQLTEYPKTLENDLKQGNCRYQNFAARDKGVHSVPVEQVEELSVARAWNSL